MHRTWVCWLLAGLFLTVTGPGRADQRSAFDVPRIEGVQVDGRPFDWGAQGLEIALLTSAEGELRPADDLDASARLAWDDRGLLLLLSVHDTTAYETPGDSDFWQHDSVELFMAPAPGASGVVQLVVGPGRDAAHPELRRQFYDYRTSPQPRPELQAEAARTTFTGGYLLEVLLSWANLGIKPVLGRECGFQFYVNDSDGPGDRFQVLWYPRPGANTDTTAMHRLRLAARPGPPVRAAAGGAYDNQGRTRISVQAVEELAGKRAEVRLGAQVVAAGRLAPRQGRSGAEFYLPWPPRGRPYGEMQVMVAGRPVATVALPDADERRARLLTEAEINFHPYVFSGIRFPPCDFEQPLLVKELIGPYRVSATYYDRDYHRVTAAESPGRYGAVIEVIPEKGRRFRRFRTLFRQPGDWGDQQWWGYDAQATMRLPAEMGIAPQVAQAQGRLLSEHLKFRFLSGLYQDWGSGALLAGLYEAPPGSPPARPADDVMAQDRQWWVGLKRRLYGNVRRYPAPFVCPRPLDGPPAPTLHEGTPEEAGMQPDAAERIDAVCRTWAADSDEGFAVCVARRGVVVLQKAYGQRDGQPMTLETKSWMASITKLLSATLMMMAVDQGRVDLDDPVSRFLPPFRGVAVRTPLTVRHLYTHTNGLWGHWGDDLSDFEEIIGSYYPHLKVAQQHSYNGAGYALGGKIIEQVSGEAIPQFFQRHLLEPLGCTHTDVSDTCAGSMSTAPDIACIGQMLLNRGAYGNLRFFSEQTFQRMLPQPLSPILGPEISMEWGIGVTWFTGEGLGEGTFGHGAASSATLRIDPANELVIVMTRNQAGRNFGKYHPQFLHAIVEGIR